MAINNLTGFNPFEIDQSKNFRASESAGKSIGAGIEGFGDEIKEKAARRRKANEDRKQKADEKHKADIEREQKIETETFGEFNQVKSKQSGPIANELNVLAQNDKAAFIDLSTKLQDPNVGKEERANIREQMGIIGSRAKNIAGGLTKLQENADAWNEIAITEGISNATPPALRSMMMDFANRENQENYHVDIDEDGRERLSGITTNGEEVSYYLADIANGANTFRAIPKKNKSEILDGLAKEIPVEVKQFENEYGVAQQNNTELMGQKAGELIMKTLDGEESYRGLAAEYGFDYDDLKSLENGEGLAIEGDLSEEELAKIDKNGDGYITDQDELKGYLANEMLRDLADRIPSGFKQLNTSKQQSKVRMDEYKAKEALKPKEVAKDPSKTVAQTGKLKQIAKTGDVSYINQFKGDKFVDAGVNPKKPNELAINIGTRNTPNIVKYDLTNQNDIIGLQSFLTETKPGEITGDFDALEEKAKGFYIN